MLDRLPPELLADVLDVTGQTSLDTSCLVSKRVCAVAQPILWRDIRLHREYQVASLLLGAGDAGRTGQARRLDACFSADSGDLALAKVVSVLPNLEHAETEGGYVEREGLSALCALSSASLLPHTHLRRLLIPPYV
jgi:hypothetical protein